MKLSSSLTTQRRKKKKKKKKKKNIKKNLNLKKMTIKFLTLKTTINNANYTLEFMLYRYISASELLPPLTRLANSRTSPSRIRRRTTRTRRPTLPK